MRYFLISLSQYFFIKRSQCPLPCSCSPTPSKFLFAQFPLRFESHGMFSNWCNSSHKSVRFAWLHAHTLYAHTLNNYLKGTLLFSAVCYSEGLSSSYGQLITLCQPQVCDQSIVELGFSELSFSRISESTTGYTFTPCMGLSYFPWFKHQIEGTTGFQCLFQKTQAM